MAPLNNKIPSAPPKKLPPEKMVGRLIAVEALLIVLTESYLDRSDVDDEKGKKLLATMRENTIEIAKQLGRDEVIPAAVEATEELLTVLVRNLPAMKGEFGKASEEKSGAPAPRVSRTLIR